MRRVVHCELNNKDGMEWQGRWSTGVKTDRDGYQALVIIPLNTINFSLGKGEDLRMLIFLQVSYQDNNDRELSSWDGGRVRQMAGFGTITLMRQKFYGND